MTRNERRVLKKNIAAVRARLPKILSARAEAQASLDVFEEQLRLAAKALELNPSVSATETHEKLITQCGNARRSLAELDAFLRDAEAIIDQSETASQTKPDAVQ